MTCIDEENLSDQYEGATKDSTLSNKTFLSIVERFALNATSMLDQSNTSIREDFAYDVGWIYTISHNKISRCFEKVKDNEIELASVSWVSRNNWRDWNQEKGPETRPVSWSRISAAGTTSHQIMI